MTVERSIQTYPEENPTSHFSLRNESAYQQWRAQKIAGYPHDAEELRVQIRDGMHLSVQEYSDLYERCRRANMAIYHITEGDIEGKELVRQLGRQFGLQRLDYNICADEDSITSLQVVDEGKHRNYIPYTNRALSWHTDGYYNTPEHTIRALVMHCVQDAAEGGENMLLDPEIAFIHLRDTNPAYISALMHPEAMTIPPNTEEGAERGTQSGPVFSIDAATQSLHMRYSARKRNIIWRDDADTHDAVACLTALLEGDSRYILRYRLQPGEGIICNNVLHNRTAFNDSPDSDRHRLLYRARYYDRVSNT